MHIINRIRWRHNPWGTLQHESNGLDINPSMPTFCTLLWRYDSNHLRARSAIPNSSWRRLINISWLTVSAPRSNTTSRVTSCEFIFIRILLTIRKALFWDYNISFPVRWLIDWYWLIWLPFRIKKIVCHVQMNLIIHRLFGELRYVWQIILLTGL